MNYLHVPVKPYAENTVLLTPMINNMKISEYFKNNERLYFQYINSLEDFIDGSLPLMDIEAKIIDEESVEVDYENFDRVQWEIYNGLLMYFMILQMHNEILPINDIFKKALEFPKIEVKVIDGNYLEINLENQYNSMINDLHYSKKIAKEFIEMFFETIRISSCVNPEKYYVEDMTIQIMLRQNMDNEFHRYLSTYCVKVHMLYLTMEHFNKKPYMFKYRGIVHKLATDIKLNDKGLYISWTLDDEKITYANLKAITKTLDEENIDEIFKNGFDSKLFSEKMVVEGINTEVICYEIYSLQQQFQEVLHEIYLSDLKNTK